MTTSPSYTFTASANRTLVANFASSATIDPSRPTLQIGSASGSPGASVVIPVSLSAKGNENALSFSLNFDAAALTFTGASLGAGVPTASLVVNTNQAASGKVGVVISLPVNQSITAGTVELLTLTFLAGKAPGTTIVGFGNTPAPESASDNLGNDLAFQFVDGTISIQGGGQLPSIITQPVDVNARLGGTATLSVSASGGSSYQWQLNGTNIQGANGASLTLSSLSTDSAGLYTVVVSNSSGSVTSIPATLALFGDLKMYAGMTLAGPVGTLFRVEYTDAMGDSAAWQVLTNITLSSSPFLVIDPQSAGTVRRYYRAVLLR